ncbi:iron-containing alcohol dehydrogenase [Thalassotalea montiporae]
MRSTINKYAIKCLSTFFPTKKPTLFQGLGATAKLTELMVVNGHKRPLIIVDGFLNANGAIKSTVESFTQAGCEVSVFDEVAANPTFKIVEDCLSLAIANKCDSVLVVGGGSAIDTAKVVSAALTNGAVSSKLIGMLKVKNPPLPLYAVPSTSGTGSEVTAIAVISDTSTHKKQFFIDPKYVPVSAALDPKLIASLPPEMTSTTGMDALTHAIEAYTSTVKFSDAERDAVSAIRLLVKYLPIAYQDGSDLHAREMVALGSFLAGYAFSKTGLGYVHAISHQISAHYNTPHGLANAVILPKVLRYNQSVCQSRFAELERALATQPKSLDEKVLAADFIKRIDQLSEEVQIPATLEGLKDSDFDAIARDALSEAKESYAVPKVMKASNVKTILQAIVNGERNVVFA